MFGELSSERRALRCCGDEVLALKKTEEEV